MGALFGRCGRRWAQQGARLKEVADTLFVNEWHAKQMLLNAESHWRCCNGSLPHSTRHVLIGPLFRARPIWLYVKWTKPGIHYEMICTKFAQNEAAQRKPAKAQVHNFAMWAPTATELSLFSAVMLDLFFPLMVIFLGWMSRSALAWLQLAKRLFCRCSSCSPFSAGC